MGRCVFLGVLLSVTILVIEGAATADVASCPSDMQEVDGLYCPSVSQTCLRWLDPKNPGPNGPVQCAEFAPTTCLSTSLVRKHFCMDRYEWPNRAGELPEVQMSWIDAKASCEGVGKRLCLDSEFTFACEGPTMKPYPYGDGLHRDSTACNIDRPAIDPFTTTAAGQRVEKALALVDQRVPAGSMPACVSDFGVHDIVGNADEWVVNESGKPYVSGLKSGHWVEGARNRCRPMTDVHNPPFKFYVTGARCCANAGGR